VKPWNILPECALKSSGRSSSNVEGRNGVLSLWHHSFHNLSPRKLRALTVIHNYYIRRRYDGTTAAERFFEQQQDDLFEYLLMTLPPPKRPSAQRRSQSIQGIPNSKVFYSVS